MRLIIPFGLAYFLGMFTGSVNSILAPTLIDTFKLSPTEIGFISSINLIAFGLAQFPIGVFLDRYGARKTIIGMLIAGIAGNLLFAVAQSYFILAASRAIVGFGISGILMASFKSYTYWLTKDRLPLVFSLQSFIGGTGFMLATRPVSIMLRYIHWRTMILLCAAAFLITVLLMIFVVPDDATEGGEGESLLTVLKDMLGFMKDKRLIYVAPVLVATEAVLFAFSYLWIGLWLRDVAMFEERAVGLMMFLSSCGIALGYLLNGVLADNFTRSGKLTWEKLYLYIGISFCAFFAVLTFLGGPTTSPLWAVVMFLTTMSMIAFPIAGRLCDIKETGRIFALINFLIFFASFIAQWFTGVIINCFPAVDGRYSPRGYAISMGVLLVVNIAAVIHLYVSLPKIEKLKEERGCSK